MIAKLSAIQVVTLRLDKIMLCACGQKATQVIGKVSNKNCNSLKQVQVYCNDCHKEAKNAKDISG